MERITCKCGKRESLEKAVIDKDGNWQCAACAAESEIIILCNSSACVADVSYGNWPNLHNRNIFTCNMAYLHYRTAGRHLNIFSDTANIVPFIDSRGEGIYKPWKYDRVEHIINVWDLEQKGVSYSPQRLSKAPCKISPVTIGATSAINALFYLYAAEDFDVIHLVGYTRNEWEGGYRKEKQEMFRALLHKFDVQNPRPHVYTYSRKKT